MNPTFKALELLNLILHEMRRQEFEAQKRHREILDKIGELSEQIGEEE